MCCVIIRVYRVHFLRCCLRRSLEKQGSICLLEVAFCGMWLLKGFEIFQFPLRMLGVRVGKQEIVFANRLSTLEKSKILVCVSNWSVTGLWQQERYHQQSKWVWMHGRDVWRFCKYSMLEDGHKTTSKSDLQEEICIQVVMRSPPPLPMSIGLSLHITVIWVRSMPGVKHVSVPIMMSGLYINMREELELYG